MIQSIIIGILTLGACAYLGRLVYKSFASTSCETGCGKCGAIDVDHIVSKFEKKTKPTP